MKLRMILPTVASLIAGCAAPNGSLERVQGTVAERSGQSVHWNRGGPEDAQLESVRTESDSVTIEGQAQDASRVLSALKGTPGLNAIRSTSSILRELGTDQMPVERWRFSMRVDHRAVARP